MRQYRTYNPSDAHVADQQSLSKKEALLSFMGAVPGTWQDALAQVPGFVVIVHLQFLQQVPRDTCVVAVQQQHVLFAGSDVIAQQTVSLTQLHVEMNKINGCRVEVVRLQNPWSSLCKTIYTYTSTLTFALQALYFNCNASN